MRGYRNRLVPVLSGCAIIAASWAAWHMAVHPTGSQPDTGATTRAFYIWQRRWSTEVLEAVDRAAPHTGSFMVLAGEVDGRGENLATAHARPEWASLAEAGVPITLVFRADVSLVARLENAAGRTAVAKYLTALAERRMAEASSAGVHVAGIQLDYDCPTSKLSRYAQLLDTLELDRKRIALSVTALPTWLESAAFRELVAGLDYYVLQVHSLEKPSTIDDGTVLCRTERIPGYLARANALPTPFYLALPTYGYELAYGRNGRFLGLAAEGPRPEWGADARTRVIMADPDALAKLAGQLEAAPPQHMRGIVWFRLSVESDRLNWPWPTMLAVMAGRVPEASLAAEIRRPQHGLYEVWIRNTGEGSPAESVEVRIACDRRGIQARDLLNGFAEASISATGFRLLGPAPPPGGEILAGWYRCQDGGLTHCAARLRQEDPS